MQRKSGFISEAQHHLTHWADVVALKMIQKSLGAITKGTFHLQEFISRLESIFFVEGVNICSFDLEDQLPVSSFISTICH